MFKILINLIIENCLKIENSKIENFYNHSFKIQN